MNSIVTPSRALLKSVRHAGTCVCVVIALALGPVAVASAAWLPNLPSLKVVRVSGSAANTVTSLEFLDDVTILIEAEQVGHLTHFGGFTGRFSYVAVGSPAAIALLGTATLTNDKGEQLFLTAAVLETGTDYPYTVTGTLIVTGGTGRYAGATGSIAVSGVDDESLTDIFTLDGTLITTAVR